MKLTVPKGSHMYFTSDTHFTHKNICEGITEWKKGEGEFRTRPFQTLDEMDDELIKNINDMVGPEDILFHLGDWSFGGFENIERARNRIMCQNIHLILGNHDHHIEKDKDGVRSLFKSVHQAVELELKWNVGTMMSGQKTFYLNHTPIASWPALARGVIHIHGHMHFTRSKRIGPGKMIDVGVDGNNLRPYRLGEVLYEMKEQPIKSMYDNDHHTINR